MQRRLRRYGKGGGTSYAEGVFATLELLATRPDAVEGVLLSSRGGPNEGVAKIRARCAQLGIETTVDDRTIERLTPRGSHLAIGIFRPYETALDSTADHVVLVQPADMGNLGTIARTMAGFGFRDLALVRPAVDAFDPKVVRASMGAVFRLSLVYVDSFDEYARAFPRPVFPFMTNGRADPGAIAFPSPCTLVFGNESSGLSASFDAIGTSVRIAQSDAVDSLSLPVAVAIALYACRRTLHRPSRPPAQA